MHNVLPFRLIKDNSQELTILADHLLKEQTSLEMMTLSDERTAYSIDYQSRLSCTSGLELFYPVTLDAVSGEVDTLYVIIISPPKYNVSFQASYGSSTSSSFLLHASFSFSKHQFT